MGYFEASLVVQPKLIEGRPIVRANRERVGAQLLGNLAESALSGV
jgi:hypothetical protein